jgi:shikimate kinase
VSAATVIVLMGLRGSGKSTLGRALAERLGRRFVDLDDRTAAALGCATPGEALRTHGEPAFRGAEAEALCGALGEAGIVLALGGGTPTAPGAADLLRERSADGRAAVLYLRASAAALAERLAVAEQRGGPERPPLVGDDPIGEIGLLLERRDGLYRELAGSVLHLDGVGEAGALAMVVAWGRAV